MGGSGGLELIRSTQKLLPPLSSFNYLIGDGFACQRSLSRD